MGCGNSIPVSPENGQATPTGVAPGGVSGDTSKPRKNSTTETKMEARAKFQRKKNVRVRADDAVVDFAAIPDVPKSDEDRTFLQEALKKQWLFQSMDEEALGMVISKMSTREYNEGDEIVTQVRCIVVIKSCCFSKCKKNRFFPVGFPPPHN